MIENDSEKDSQQRERATYRWYRGTRVKVRSVLEDFALIEFTDGSTYPVPVGSLTVELAALQPGNRYRVGNHQPQNIYDGDVYIGVMFSAPAAARVVDALNAAERAAAAEKWNRDAL
jgi:hypothetical protein